jgi:hypothetical protein
MTEQITYGSGCVPTVYFDVKLLAPGQLSVAYHRQADLSDPPDGWGTLTRAT